MRNHKWPGSPTAAPEASRSSEGSFLLLLLCFVFTKLVSEEYRMVSFINDSEALSSLEERLCNDSYNAAILY